MYLFSSAWSSIWNCCSDLNKSIISNWVATIFLLSLFRLIYVSLINTFFNILYSTNFIKYCLSVVCNFFLYLNFKTFQTFFILILFIKCFWSSTLIQIMSQYKIFVFDFWFLKSRLLKRNVNLLAKMLIDVISQTNYRFSSVSHFCMRVNHWLQFLQVRIEMNCHFVKKLLKFMMMIVDILYKKWIK